MNKSLRTIGQSLALIKTGIMKTLFIASMIITLASCKDDVSGSSFFNLDTTIRISVSDHEGSDLLDPSNPNGFDFSQIRLFDLKENEKKEVPAQSSGLSKNFLLYKHPSEFRLWISPIHPEMNQNSATTFIK